MNIQSLLSENIKYFEDHKFIKLSTLLREIEISYVKCTNRADQVKSFAHQYDYSEQIQVSGYRSALLILDSAALKIVKNLNNLKKERTRYFFDVKKFECDFYDWSVILEFHELFLNILLHFHAENGGNLFTQEVSTSSFKDFDRNFCLPTFRGRHAGFYLLDDVSEQLKPIMSLYATIFNFAISKDYMIFRYPKAFFSFISFMNNHEKRAIVSNKAASKGNIKFLRYFWEFGEKSIPLTLVNWLGKKIDVNEIFHINPANELKVKMNGTDKEFVVPIPLSHVGLKDIQCRLLSNKQIKQPMLDVDHNFNEQSRFLIYHVHGGGFVSQTSTSHESYLKEITTKLDIPIVSIDYSLLPFPRALEEVFYTYCWILNNSEKFGVENSPRRRIILIGDSAGSNLLNGCAIRCIQENIPKPSHLFNFYGFFNLGLNISPSKCLSAIDAFLSPMVLSNILESYLSTKQTTKQQKMTHEQQVIEAVKNFLVSPIHTPDEILRQFPPSTFITTVFDVGLDDSIDYAKKLKNLNVDVEFHAFKDLPHAFLNFIDNSKGCLQAFEESLNLLKTAMSKL